MHITKTEIITFDLSDPDQVYKYYECVLGFQGKGYTFEIMNSRGSDIKVKFTKGEEQND
ncbi:hypothetical protein [Bacillus cereus]|uniref:hypothetical protein n=1 Tax=Bacillus cereus TaxID=1396 RepID=UPI0016435ACB|nr:hypothetical protein [Bacillus cereus]MBJ7955822.1 hypothetical protein [Bacillus cereus]